MPTEDIGSPAVQIVQIVIDMKFFSEKADT
jgi:hypothetical protein